jgi:hypothetical protein
MEVTFRKDCCLQLQFSVAWGIARLRQIVKQYHETMVYLSWPCKRYPWCNELCMGSLWVPQWKTLNQSQNGACTKPVCHMLDEQGEAQLISQLASAFSSATLAIYFSSPWVSSLQKCTHNLSILHPGLWRRPVHLWPPIHPQVTASPTLLPWNCKDMPNDQEEESGEVILQRNHPPLPFDSPLHSEPHPPNFTRSVMAGSGALAWSIFSVACSVVPCLDT